MASDSLLAFGNTAVSIIIGHMGTSFIAAYAIVAVIQRFSTVFTSGIGMASSVITGNRIGEGKSEQAYHEAITLVSLAVAIGILAGVFIKAFGPQIVGLYDIREETYGVAMEMISAVSLMIVFQSMQSVITKGVLRGGGDTKFCMMIDAVFLWIVSVPLGYYTGLVLHLNAFIVFLSLKADWMIKSVIGTFRIISGKWIRNLTE
jgi:Na+-driven multidrug efflux pump